MPPAPCPVTDGLPTLSDPWRDADFLHQMERLLPWHAMADLARQSLAQAPAPMPPTVQHDAQPLVRLYFLQSWFGLSDRAMADMLLCIPLYRSFAQLAAVMQPLPDAADIRRFREHVTHTALGAVMRRELQQMVPPPLQTIGIQTAPDAALVAWAHSQQHPAADAPPRAALH